MPEPHMIARQVEGTEFSVRLAGAKRERSGALGVDASLWNGEAKYTERIALNDQTQIQRWASAAGDREGIPTVLLERAVTALFPEVVATLQETKTTNKQADRLMCLADDWELFHDGETTYARMEVGDHCEVHPLNSTAIRRLLKRAYYQTCSGAPSSQAMQDALGVFDSRAAVDGPERQVFRRVAEVDGRIYVDLCDERWRVIEIDEHDWRILDEPPVLFRRAPGMRALPEPGRGGSLDDLRRFLNLGDGDIGDKQFPLAIAWLLVTLRTQIPYPILIVQGEQGSAKSTFVRILRALIDPSVLPLRSPPRDERDLAIAANKGFVVAFDNLTTILQWLSDALCRLSTGGGLGVRELYKDADEVIFECQNPVAFTGIANPATAGDLLDRAICLDLAQIPEKKRRDEREVWGDFEAARPAILGALLDTCSGALRELPNVHLDSLPRMADFARWAVAVERALGWEPGSFMRAYGENRTDRASHALDASPVAGPLQTLVEASPRGWTGTAGELLTTLEATVPENVRRSRAWPRSPQGMAAALKRLAPDLRQLQIVVEQLPRENDRRPWRVAKEAVRNQASPTSPSSPEPSDSALGSQNEAGDILRPASDIPTSPEDKCHHLPAESHQPKWAEASQNPGPGDVGDVGDDSLLASSITFSRCGSGDVAESAPGLAACPDCEHTFTARRG